MKIAVDMDGTLTDRRMQIFMRNMMASGHDVWVITARDKESCQQPYFKRIMKDAGIPEMNMVYTSERAKWPVIEEMGFDVFIDNSKREVIDVACHTKCIPLQFINEI